MVAKSPGFLDFLLFLLFALIVFFAKIRKSDVGYSVIKAITGEFIYITFSIKRKFSLFVFDPAKTVFISTVFCCGSGVQKTPAEKYFFECHLMDKG
jgi:hypothetical protein